MSEILTVQMKTVLTLLRELPARERLHVIAQVLPEAERELAFPASPPAPVAWDEAALAEAEAALEQELLEQGFLSEIPTRFSSTDYPLPELIDIPGTPLSEVIIAERR